MDNRGIGTNEQRQLTKEELQETQVLNLQEVRKAIRFEKITSKKPAIAVAIIGVLLLLFGTSFQVLKTIKANNVQKRTVAVTSKKKKKYATTEVLNATKTTMNNPDSTNTTYNIVYYFSEDELIRETRKYNVSAVTGKEEGTKSIAKLTEEYKKLINSTEGYKIAMNPINDTVIEINMDFDYTKLDLTKVNNLQSTKEFTKVIYKLGSTYNDIRKDMLDKGFTVQ